MGRLSLSRDSLFCYHHRRHQFFSTMSTTTLTCTNSLPRYLPPPSATADKPWGAREQPLRIGLQLKSVQLQTQPSPLFDATIMHRVVSPVLEDVTASLDATCVELATAFQVPVAVVASHWLTSRSPMELPGFDRRVGYERKEVMTTSRRVVLGEGERRAQRELMEGVTRKLQAYVRDGVVEEEGAVTGMGNRCGFSKLRAHADVDVRGKRVVKGGGGLYRCALSISGERWYAEVLVKVLGGEGGLVIGVGGDGHVLNRIPGEVGGVGLHASGKIIVDGVWKDAEFGLTEDDVVGILVDGGVVKLFVNGKQVGSERVRGRVGVVACLYRRGCCVELRCCEAEWEHYKKEWRVGGVCNEVETSAMSVESGGSCRRRDSPNRKVEQGSCSQLTP